MLEQEMIFALGFFTAGLLALACLPAVWRRALRLTSNRLSQLVPLSAEEIAAEHAGLRARHAVERRRLEQKVEAGEKARADLMATSARRDVTIGTLEEASRRDAAAILALTAERDGVRRELADLAGQDAAANLALVHLEGLAETRLFEREDARRSLAELGEKLDRDRATIAAFETRVLGLETKVSDLAATLERVRADLRQAVADGRHATEERDGARAAAEALAAKRDGLAAEAERLAAELAQARFRLGTAEEAAVARAQTIASQAETIADLRAEVAMHEEAVRGANARLETLRAEAATRPPDGPAPDEGLDEVRAALRQVADDVLKLTAKTAPEG